MSLFKRKRSNEPDNPVGNVVSDGDKAEARSPLYVIPWNPALITSHLVMDFSKSPEQALKMATSMGLAGFSEEVLEMEHAESIDRLEVLAPMFRVVQELVRSTAVMAAIEEFYETGEEPTPQQVATLANKYLDIGIRSTASVLANLMDIGVIYGVWSSVE